jgi:hypothetical protein
VKVVRFTELRTESIDTMIPRVLEKVAQEPLEGGLLMSRPDEYWWDYWIAATNIVKVDPQGQPQQATVPMLQIVIGTKGVLLGPDNYVYFFLATDMLPDEELLTRGFKQALQYFQEQRAVQGSTQNGIISSN